MKSYTLTVLPGDGIGPEVMGAALAVLNVAGDQFGIKFELTTGLAGGCSIDKFGEPLTNDVLETCRQSDAVLLGAVGGPKWDRLPQEKKPEKGLLKLREGLELYSNLRPANIYPALAEASSLKKDVIVGSDVMVVRELTGGIYFGNPRGKNEKEAWNTLRYTSEEVERIAKTAFKISGKRQGKLTSVHKANVLESSQFWREIVEKVHSEYPDIVLDEMYVDNAAMQLVRDPKQFDVIVTQNLFGDILSDVAAMITGSLGMLPSASLGEKYALYEPVHGTAPEIAGQDKANPIAMIGSIAMMLDITFNLPEAAERVNRAIDSTLDKGFRTADIARSEKDKIISTSEIRDKIIEALEKESDSVSFHQMIL